MVSVFKPSAFPRPWTLRQLFKKRVMYIEHSLRLYSTRIGVLLGHCNYFLGEPLGFFGFRPCCGDGFVFEEGGDEVAEEGLSVGGFAAEMAVFEVAAGHWEEGGWEERSVERPHARLESGEKNYLLPRWLPARSRMLICISQNGLGLNRKPRSIELGLELPMLA